MFGFAEVANGDRRSDSVEDAAYFAATAALMGAGSTFHSDGGILSQLWGPVQAAAARAWFDAAKWVPVEAQLWPYQRGVTLDFSRPGRPAKNAFIKSFNGHFHAPDACRCGRKL